VGMVAPVSVAPVSVALGLLVEAFWWSPTHPHASARLPEPVWRAQGRSTVSWSLDLPDGSTAQGIIRQRFAMRPDGTCGETLTVSSGRRGLSLRHRHVMARVNTRLRELAAQPQEAVIGS